MLGHGADPEQAFIGGSEQGLEEGDGFEDRLLGDEPTVPEVRAGHSQPAGLVVLSSCSHSGAVNVLLNAQRVTGVQQVHAFVGGLHLSGSTFEPIIPETVAHFSAIAPAVVMPLTLHRLASDARVGSPAPGCVRANQCRNSTWL